MPRFQRKDRLLIECVVKKNVQHNKGEFSRQLWSLAVDILQRDIELYYLVLKLIMQVQLLVKSQRRNSSAIGQTYWPGRRVTAQRHCWESVHVTGGCVSPTVRVSAATECRLWCVSLWGAGGGGGVCSKYTRNAWVHFKEFPTRVLTRLSGQFRYAAPLSRRLRCATVLRPGDLQTESTWFWTFGWNVVLAGFHAHSMLLVCTSFYSLLLNFTYNNRTESS